MYRQMDKPMDIYTRTDIHVKRQTDRWMDGCIGGGGHG